MRGVGGVVDAHLALRRDGWLSWRIPYDNYHGTPVPDLFEVMGIDSRTRELAVPCEAGDSEVADTVGEYIKDGIFEWLSEKLDDVPWGEVAETGLKGLTRMAFIVLDITFTSSSTAGPEIDDVPYVGSPDEGAFGDGDGEFSDDDEDVWDDDYGDEFGDGDNWDDDSGYDDWGDGDGDDWDDNWSVMSLHHPGSEWLPGSQDW
jgi:hypothetical protein